MGTQCAVVLAEIILGFLEETNNLKPPNWLRYIDDGLGHIRKGCEHEDRSILLGKLNNMDTLINWTSDPISENIPFLDLNINQISGKISTYHKPTAGFACYVPWSSSHPFHMKCNIAFSLYYRAVRINSDQSDIFRECERIDLSLLSLGYPLKVLRTQRDKALSHTNKITITPLVSPAVIYFTTTRNSVSTSKKFNEMFSTFLGIIKNSPFFQQDKVVIKRSFRQPPSVNTRLIWSSFTDTHTESEPCRMPACKICRQLYLAPHWTSNDGFKIKTARATCCSKNIVYILVDCSTNEVLYVGQTCQRLNYRLVGNRSKNSWMRNTNYFIVPVQGAFEAVKKIDLEQILIQELKPLKNKQRDYFWWNCKSNYSNAPNQTQ